MSFSVARITSIQWARLRYLRAQSSRTLGTRASPTASIHFSRQSLSKQEDRGRSVTNTAKAGQPTDGESREHHTSHAAVTVEAETAQQLEHRNLSPDQTSGRVNNTEASSKRADQHRKKRASPRFWKIPYLPHRKINSWRGLWSPVTQQAVKSHLRSRFTVRHRRDQVESRILSRIHRVCVTQLQHSSNPEQDVASPPWKSVEHLLKLSDKLVQELDAIQSPSLTDRIKADYAASLPHDSVKHPMSIWNESKRAYFRDKTFSSDFLLPLLAIACKTKPLDHIGATTMTLPDVVVAQICGTAEGNMWFDHTGTGCAIIAEAVDGSGNCNIVLDGAVDAQNEAMHKLTTSANHATTNKPRNGASDTEYEEQPLAWFLGRVKSLCAQQKSRTSSASFMLKRSNSARDVSSSKIEDTADTLFDMFTNSETRHFASVKALEVALAFCREHTQLNNRAHALWEAAMLLGLRPDASCFNQDLGRALATKNARRAADLLMAMDTLGVQADRTTCALVLRFAHNVNARRWVLSLAEQHLGTTREGKDKDHLIRAVIRTELCSYLRQPQGLDRFIEEMQAIFGHGWLDRNGVALMLRVSIMKVSSEKHCKNFEQIPAILAIAHEMQLDLQALDRDGSRAISRFAQIYGDMDHAISTFTQIYREGFNLDSRFALETLFILAYKNYRYNTCRLIWTQAALLGSISFTMRNTVRTHIITNQDIDHDDAAHRRLVLLGNYVVGAAGEMQLDPDILPHLAMVDTWPDTCAMLMTWFPQGPARTEQLQLSDAIMERDLRMCKRFNPIAHDRFLLLLQEAHKLDDHWEKAQTVLYTDPIALLKQRTPIVLQPRIVPVHESQISRNHARKFSLNGTPVDVDTTADSYSLSSESDPSIGAGVQDRTKIEHTQQGVGNTAADDELSQGVIQESDRIVPAKAFEPRAARRHSEDGSKV